MTFKSLPLTVREIKATEATLERIYNAAYLGLKNDSLALAAGMLPVEFNRLKQHDPMAEIAELKGRFPEGDFRRRGTKQQFKKQLPLELEEKPGDQWALFYLGNQWYALGEWERAAQAYEAATHNTITRASFDVRSALHREAALNRDLGVTIKQAFEPCTSLRLASIVLQQGYGLALRYYAGLDAISATYSLYNTGTLTRGLRNGYVGRVVGNAGVSDGVRAMPVALSASTGTSEIPSDAERDGPSLLAALVEENTSHPGQRKAERPPPPPSWDVFAKADYERAQAAPTGED